MAQHAECDIIQACIADIRAIMRIEQNAFANGVVEQRASFMERLTVFPEGFLLLKQRGKTAGYFCTELWNITESPYETSLFTLGHSALSAHKPQGNMLYISSMGILSAYRGKGLGEFLFTESLVHLTKKIPHLAKIVLVVNENWLPARAIYKKAGFAEVQILPDFFADKAQKKPAKQHAARQNGIVMDKHML